MDSPAQTRSEMPRLTASEMPRLTTSDLLARGAVVGGGMVIHAISTFIVTTILPTVVRDIGGLEFFAWSTTLYVVASAIGAACAARLLARFGARVLYRCALTTFGIGTIGCALAPVMAALLAGRAVQGLGAGVLSAMSFSMVRVLFPQRMWPRALAVISGAWGIATLAGPAVGGIFAQYHAWRAAFWAVFACVPLLLLLVERALPRNLARPAPPRTRMAFANLALLVTGALLVSLGSVLPAWPAKALSLTIAIAAFVLFVRREATPGLHLLPAGACNPRTPLGAAYACMLTLIIGMTVEIFVSYFLQVLHGLTPLHAGYLTALMSGGWTAGSILSSTLGQHAARRVMQAGPPVLGAGLLGLCLLMPHTGLPIPRLTGIGASLLAMGMGIGMCWPLLGARVFAHAAEHERDLAATSIAMVITIANAIGSALGGVITNFAGLITPGGPPGAAQAAFWLFAIALAWPIFATLAMRRLLRAPHSP
jgi:MFS family permease